PPGPAAAPPPPPPPPAAGARPAAGEAGASGAPPGASGARLPMMPIRMRVATRGGAEPGGDPPTSIRGGSLDRPAPVPPPFKGTRGPRGSSSPQGATPAPAAPVAIRDV